MSINVKKLSGGVGVQVTGLDLSQPITDDVQQKLYDTWLEHGIVVFPDTGRSPEEQLELSRCFGELEVHPIESIRLEGYPELIWLSNKYVQMAPVYYYDGKATLGRIPWHTDLVYTTTPNAGALLRMLETPEDGGQTGWIDTAMAYEALPEETKRRIDGVEAVFRFNLDPRTMRFGRPRNVERAEEGDAGRQDIDYEQFPDIVHPLVWEHPETGRRSLNVSPLHLCYVLGMDQEEGDALLEELVAHATDPKFSYIHDWQPDDMVLWDNRRTMHCALGHPPEQIRMVHRTTIKGNIAMGRLLHPEGEKAEA